MRVLSTCTEDPSVSCGLSVPWGGSLHVHLFSRSASGLQRVRWDSGMGKCALFRHRQKCPVCVQLPADCLLLCCPASHPAVRWVDFSQGAHPSGTRHECWKERIPGIFCLLLNWRGDCRICRLCVSYWPEAVLQSPTPPQVRC